MLLGRALRSFLLGGFRFSGRMRRSEYWLIVILFPIGLAASWFAAGQLGRGSADSAFEGIVESAFAGSHGALIFAVLCAVPLLAATSRRLQDSGFHGLLAMLPVAGHAATDAADDLAFRYNVIIGADFQADNWISEAEGLPLALSIVLLLILLLLPPQKHEGRYGPNPREVSP